MPEHDVRRRWRGGAVHERVEVDERPHQRDDGERDPGVASIAIVGPRRFWTAAVALGRDSPRTTAET